MNRILLLTIVVVIAVGLPLSGIAKGDYLYSSDSGTATTTLNASDTSEARDNWFGNLFTVQGGGERIDRLDFLAGGDTGYSAKALVYSGDPAVATPTLVSQQDFTTAAGWNPITLTTPVDLAIGQKFLVSVFIGNVPGDKYPYSCDASATLSWWDRSDPGQFAVSNISGAKTMDTALSPGGWVPSESQCRNAMIRAHGSAVPEPASLVLLALGALGLVASRAVRRKP